MDVQLLPWQEEFFFKSDYRKRLVHKGRRLGLTRGASIYFILMALDRKVETGLWGDTVAGNIDKYVERYFKPILKDLPRKLWKWDAQRRELKILNTTYDFRSADRPQNWEGFGYDLVFLNEAGIILRNSYLWDNAVSPMLLDNPDSIVIIGGTPKGKHYKGEKHKFYELAEKARKNPLWEVKNYSTFDNPLLDEEEIKELISGLSPAVVEQEIYGKFIDEDENSLISPSMIYDAAERSPDIEICRQYPGILGVDVGWSSDPTVCTFRQHSNCEKPVIIPPSRDDSVTVGRIAKVINKFRPDHIFVDYGYGTGVVAMLRDLGHPVIGVSFGSNATAVETYANKRAEMYDLARTWLESGGCLPNDEKLVAELLAITVTEDSKGRIMLEKKAKIAKTTGGSTNHADSFVLTFAFPVDRYPKKDAWTEVERFNQVPRVSAW